jgi:hypothetical protein
VLARGLSWFGGVTDDVGRLLTVLALLVGVPALALLALGWWAVALGVALGIALMLEEGAYLTWKEERRRVEDLAAAKRMHEKVAFGNPLVQGISNTWSKARQLRRRIAALDDQSPHVPALADEVFDWSAQVVKMFDNPGYGAPELSDEFEALGGIQPESADRVLRGALLDYLDRAISLLKTMEERLHDDDLLLGSGSE